MTVPGLEIAVRREGADTVVEVRGEVDVMSAPELTRVVSDLIEGGTSSIVLDLSAVTFIDSTGLSALISGRNLCREQQGDMRLRDPSPPAIKILAITGLDAVFGIESSS